MTTHALVVYCYAFDRKRTLTLARMRSAGYHVTTTLGMFQSVLMHSEVQLDVPRENCEKDDQQQVIQEK